MTKTIMTNILNNEQNPTFGAEAESEVKPKTNLLSKVKTDKNVPVKETVALDSEAIRISELILTNVVTEQTSAGNKKHLLNLEVTSSSNSNSKKNVEKTAANESLAKVGNIGSTSTSLLSPPGRQSSVLNRSHSPPPTTALGQADKKQRNPAPVTDSLKEEPENGMFISDEIFRDSASRSRQIEKEKSNLDREIEALEKKHAAKLERISENQREKKIDLSRTDVNANRPAVLGPSRFEVSNYNSYKKAGAGASEGEKSIPRRGESTAAGGRSHQVARSVTTVAANSPELQRKRFDSNFNAVPEPFRSTRVDYSKSNANVPALSSSKLSELKSVTKPAYTSPVEKESPSSFQATLVSPQYSALSSLPSPATYTGPYTATRPTSGPTPAAQSTLTRPPTTTSIPSISSSASSRAKSEGSGLSGSVQYKDIYHQIQASKDRYKSDVERAMNFDRTTIKPPVIREKFPRPDATPLIRRRQEREATVINAIVTDRAKRGKSDDFLRSNSFRLQH